MKITRAAALLAFALTACNRQAATSSGSTSAGAGTGASVSGTVMLSPEIGTPDTGSGSALYVIARSAASGQILAVKKEAGTKLPQPFHISAADQMTAGTQFSGPLDLTARLSRSGDAMPAAGDLEGTTKGVAVGAADVTITLDTVRK
jgi:cytochrome c-type biogenesis protein CcmH